MVDFTKVETTNEVWNAELIGMTLFKMLVAYDLSGYISELEKNLIWM